MLKPSIENTLRTLPDAPGIYLFFGKDRELLYVGKATSLKQRVRSYFRGAAGRRPIEQFVDAVERITYEQTDSVLEAVIAEANAIRKRQPRYNVLGKDNKSWNYILITREPYPRVVTMRQHELELHASHADVQQFQFVRGPLKKKYAYIFGPYPGLNTKATMKLLRSLFSFSTCIKQGDTPEMQRAKRSCFYRQMGQCLGVCTGDMSPTVYKQHVIAPLVQFLKGGKKKVITMLETRMKRAARAEAFEEAARLRNQMQSLTRIHDVAILNASWFASEQTAQRAQAISRIEGYDISHLGSTGVVGSMVVFDSAGPVVSEYRKFKIKTVTGQNDVASLEEVLRRRFGHEEWRRPDLILIDGGAPQVQRAQQVLSDVGIGVPIVGIAKGPRRDKNEFVLPRTSTLTAAQVRSLIAWIDTHRPLLISVRDEAHRFAVAYQRSLRKISRRASPKK